MARRSGTRVARHRELEKHCAATRRRALMQVRPAAAARCCPLETAVNRCLGHIGARLARMNASHPAGNVSRWVWPQAVQRLGWMGCDCMTCAARPPPWLPPRVRRPRSRWRTSATGHQGAALPAWLTDRQPPLPLRSTGSPGRRRRPGRGQVEGRGGPASLQPGLAESRPAGWSSDVLSSSARRS